MTNITKLPAIIHGNGKDEGKLFTQLKHDGYKTYLYAVQNGDVTMHEVFNAHILDGIFSTRHTYPTGADFGKTAFGVADPAAAEKLFEELSNA